MPIQARANVTLTEPQEPYLHLRYSNDGGKTFTPADPAVQAKAEAEEHRNLLTGTEAIFGTAVREAIPNLTTPEYAFFVVPRETARFITDKRVTISFDLRVRGKLGQVRVYTNHHAKGKTSTNIYKYFTPLALGEWQRVSATGFFNLRTDIDPHVSFHSGYGSGIYFDIRRLKLELGETPTEWCPSPEEIARGTTAGRWRGEVVSTSPYPPTAPAAFTWVDTKGEKGDRGEQGEQGKQGEAGKDGKNGADGKNGKDGVGVASIVTEFAVNASPTTAPTSGWTATPPAWSTGKFLWHRSRITYTDGRAVTTVPQCDSSWQAIDGIRFSDENLLLAGDVPVSTSKYLAATYSLTASGRQLVAGEEVTVVLKGDLGERTAFSLYNTTGWILFLELTAANHKEGGLYAASGVWRIKSTHSGTTYTGDNTKILVYGRPNNGKPVRIDWIKLVRGNKTTLAYTSSTEELAAKAKAAQDAATAAAARAADTYTKAQTDHIISTSEAAAIVRARAEALAAQIEAEAARIEVERTTAALRAESSLLNNANITFRGAKETLAKAITAFLASGTFTLAGYEAKLSAPRKAYETSREAMLTALAGLGSEVGGRNLFGFHRGVVWRQEYSTPATQPRVDILPAPDLGGMRIRIAAMPTGARGHLLRIHALKLRRAGWYTASMDIRLVRASGAAFSPSANSLSIDLCDDASPTRFTLSTASQHIVHTANVSNYYQDNSAYQGFFDIEALAGNALAVGDVIEISNLMIERGSVASPWAKAEEDIAWELDNTAYLRTAFEQPSEMDGGIIFGSILQMRDVPKQGQQVGDVVSYLNGLRSMNVGGSPRPALALGVADYAKAGEREEVAFHFDGSGHLKNLYFNGAEEGLYLGSDPRTARVKLSAEAMPTIDQLVADRTKTTSMPAETLRIAGGNNHRGMAQSVGALQVIAVSGRLDGRIRLKVSGTPATGVNPTPRVTTMLHLVGEDGLKVALPLSAHYGLAGQAQEADLSTIRLPIGTYRLLMETTAYDVAAYTAELSLLTPLRYITLTDRGVYGIYSDGVLAYENENQYVMMQGGILRARGQMEIPGLLASGVIGEDGRPISLWGKAIRTERLSNGEYLIHHNIGHTDYSIIITPIGNGVLMAGQLAAQNTDLAWCYIKNVEHRDHNGNAPMTDARFCFAIVGRN